MNLPLAMPETIKSFWKVLLRIRDLNLKQCVNYLRENPYLLSLQCLMSFFTESFSREVAGVEAAELFPLEALELEFLVTLTKPEDAFEVTFTTILLGIFSPPKPEEFLEELAVAFEEFPEEAGADEFDDEAGDPEEAGVEDAPESIAF